MAVTLETSARNAACNAIVDLIDGEAVLEVTPQAHTGCRKFEARFGADAWRFVWLPELKSRNLRGVYMRVVTPGRAGIDDAVVLLG